MNDLLKDLGLSGGGGDATPAAGNPPNYTPPLHGANPHGQGDVATADLNPSQSLPMPGGIDEGETVTVGQSRGEEVNGQYQGRVVLLDENLLNVVNFGIDTQEGDAPETFAPLQAVLDPICTGLGQSANCVTVLNMSSSSNASGSQNSFSVASTDIDLNLGQTGVVSLGSGVAQSSGNISEDSSCQTATGSSNVANADVGVLVLPVIEADALQGSSSSQACNNGSSSVNQSSTVVALQAMGLPLPAAGCADGTPNTNFVSLAPLVSTVCNADTQNGGQTSAPYGVREALTVFALAGIVKAATAGPESHAVAPAAANPPGTPGDGGGGSEGQGDGGSEGESGGGGADGGPASTVAQPGGGELAFTGANVLVLALFGAALIVGGVGLARASTRRHQRTAA